MKNKQKREKNAMSTIFFTTLLQQMLNNRLLQPIIDGKKIIIMVFSNRKQEATQNLGFVVKNIVNVALLKNKIIIRVELANFY